jgi:hypothetical protein
MVLAGLGAERITLTQDFLCDLCVLRGVQYGQL